MSTQTIIETIIGFNFDDDKKSHKYVENVIREQKQIPIDEVKSVMIAELTILKSCIENNLKRELIYLPETDYKFNHWTALMYILCRQFRDITDASSVPEYYRKVAAEAGKKETRTCQELVNRLLGIINS